MRRRGSQTHKTRVGRALVAARALACAGLENLDNPEKIKEVLTNIEKTLRGAEIELASGRFETGDTPAAHAFDLEFLQATYSHHDARVAEIHFHLDRQSSSPEIPHAFMRSRLSTHSFIAQVSASAEVKGHLECAGHLDFDPIALHELPEVKESSLGIVGLQLASRGPTGNLFSMMHQNGRFADVKEFQTAVEMFLTRIGDKYSPEAVYHGSAHAIDVMSTTAWFLSSEFMQARFNPLERFMTLVASAIHDVGHKGRNNMFYIQTMDSLAIQYNDKSVNENMHLATSFSVMKEHADSNWCGLLKDSQQYMRKGLIEMVLATDPSKHATMFADFSELVCELKENPDALSPNEAGKQKCLDDKLLLLGSVLHAADISSSTKPEKIMLQWTGRLLQEFWPQAMRNVSLECRFHLSAIANLAPRVSPNPKLGL